MTRRAILLVAAAVLRADERTDVLDAVSPLAAALSNGDADEFLRRIPDDAPDRALLVENIRGLMAQSEITSSVQVRNVESGRAELDWYMEIRSRATLSVLERRRGSVVVQVRRRRVTSMQPVEFFRPAEVR